MSRINKPELSTYKEKELFNMCKIMKIVDPRMQFDKDFDKDIMIDKILIKDEKIFKSTKVEQDEDSSDDEEIDELVNKYLEENV